MPQICEEEGYRPTLFAAMQFAYSERGEARLTGDLELKAISRRIRGQRNTEAAGVKERRQYVAHDVDFDLLLTLKLLPDDRVVKHAELLSVELAVEVDGLSGHEYVNLTLRPH